MDATRRAELEQEKAKLLIELEAVAAMEAVWEQAAQKAALEQERRKKEEQELIKRRDILRLLVEAASDQATSVREDYLKLQAQGPLMIESKIEETQRLQRFRKLLHQNHANQVASYQEMTENFNDAPWVKALKEKEEKLARTKQQVKEKEAEAAELASELTRLRELVDDEIENPTCKFIAEVAALEVWRANTDEEHQMAARKQLLDDSRGQQNPNDSPHLNSKIVDKIYADCINITTSSGDGMELNDVGDGMELNDVGANVCRTPRSNLPSPSDSHLAKKGALVEPSDMIQSTYLSTQSCKQNQPSDTSPLLEREIGEAENDSQQLTRDKVSGNMNHTKRRNDTTSPNSFQFENFLRNAITVDIPRDVKPTNSDAPPRIFSGFGSCFVETWPSTLSNAQWKNEGEVNKLFAERRFDDQLRHCDAGYPRAQRISTAFISDFALFSKRQCLPNTAHLAIDYPLHWSTINNTLEAFPRTNRILKTFILCVGLEFCVRFEDFATAENELVQFYNDFFNIYQSTFAKSYMVFQRDESQSGSIEIASVPPLVVVLTIPLIVNGDHYPTESVKLLNDRIRQIVAEKKALIPMIEFYDWADATTDLLKFNEENFRERFKRLFIALHEYHVFIL